MLLETLTLYKLSDLIASNVLVIGDGYRAKNSELCPFKSGLPFARAGNINSGFQFDDADYLVAENLLKAGEKVSELGDVLFTSKGTVGRVAFVSEKTPRFVYSPQLTWWRVKDTKRIEPRFLYYWMHGREFCVQINGLRGQTDMADYVSLRDQRQMMYVTLPPLDEQKAIAHILGTLDDKIELNQQMNQTLEAIARALFKSWFIDFDPVRAKLDGRQPTGMDAETAALFPAEFEDSALGEIPKGWKIQTSESIFSVKDGTHDSPKVAEAGYPLVTSRHLKKGYIDFDNTYLISEDDFHEVNKRSKVDKNDVLITMIGTVGNLLFIDYEEVNFAIKNVGLFKTSEKPELSEYFYFYLRSDKIENYLKIRQAGTTQSYITLKTLRTIPVLLPSSELVRLFSKSVTPQLQKITATREESHLLVSIRDALLPKLLSGEIRVQDAETVVEAVT